MLTRSPHTNNIHKQSAVFNPALTMSVLQQRKHLAFRQYLPMMSNQKQPKPRLPNIPKLHTQNLVGYYHEATTSVMTEQTFDN